MSDEEIVNEEVKEPREVRGARGRDSFGETVEVIEDISKLSPEEISERYTKTITDPDTIDRVEDACKNNNGSEVDDDMEFIPVCPDCGEPLELTKETPDKMEWYCEFCMEGFTEHKNNMELNERLRIIEQKIDVLAKMMGEVRIFVHEIKSDRKETKLWMPPGTMK